MEFEIYIIKVASSPHLIWPINLAGQIWFWLVLRNPLTTKYPPIGLSSKNSLFSNFFRGTKIEEFEFMYSIYIFYKCFTRGKQISNSNSPDLDESNETLSISVIRLNFNLKSVKWWLLNWNTIKRASRRNLINVLLKTFDFIFRIPQNYLQFYREISLSSVLTLQKFERPLASCARSR